MRLDLVRTQAMSLCHRTGRDRMTVVTTYRICKEREVCAPAAGSVLPSENAHRITPFLDTHRDARLVPVEADWGRDTGAGRQILPGEDGMDGYALLEKAEGV
ncbi:MAG: hypothetical protein ACREXK_12545 [Gammaproteobacteria bacterium]